MSIGSFRLPLMPAPESTEGWKVQFFDPFGNLLKTQYVANGQDATPPTPPTFDLLTFTAWNNPYTNVTRDIDIGAIYDTTDGKTYIFVTVDSFLGLQPTIYLQKSTTDEMTINWGHGDNSVNSSSGNITIQKPTSYTAGSFTITITCAGEYRLGQNSAATTLFGDQNNLYVNIATKIYCGVKINILNSYSFTNFFRLEYITLNSNLLSSSAIRYCSSNYKLKALIFPSSLTGNLPASFLSCGSIKVVVYPDSITGNLYDYTHSNCYSLTDCILPPSITGSIVFQIFNSCTSIKKIILPAGLTSGIANNAFYNSYSVTEITLPNNLEGSIGENAFRGCRALCLMVIPAGVTSIGLSCFQDCVSILEYIFLPTIPPTLASTNVFTNIRIFTKIYVPHDSVSAYKTATNWSTYADYIYSINDRP